MIKFDYKKMIDDSLDNRGCYTPDGFLKKVGAPSIDFLPEYCVSLTFCFRVDSESKRRKEIYYKIIMSQDGAKFSGKWHGIRLTDEIMSDFIENVSDKISEIKIELEKYKFEPVGYELWSDQPDVPYYVKPGEKILCNKFFPLEKNDDHS